MARSTGYTTVNTVQYYDDKSKSTVEVQPGQPFDGPADLHDDLLKSGAIREATDEDRAGNPSLPLTAEQEAEIRGSAPQGYAAGTQPLGSQNVYPGGVDNPNDIPADVGEAEAEPRSGTGSSSDASGKLPVSRSTPGAKR